MPSQHTASLCSNQKRKVAHNLDQPLTWPCFLPGLHPIGPIASVNLWQYSGNHRKIQEEKDGSRFRPAPDSRYGGQIAYFRESNRGQNKIWTLRKATNSMRLRTLGLYLILLSIPSCKLMTSKHLRHSCCSFNTFQ
jgi:hypothetical protein